MTRVVALHRPQTISGVSVAGARLATCMPDWIPLIIGPDLTHADLVRTPFAHVSQTQLCTWPSDATALEQVEAVLEALKSLRAAVVISNDLPHGPLACALDPHLRCAGLFHGDHPRDHDLYERVVPLCHAWRAVSSTITRTISAYDPRQPPAAPCPIDVPAHPQSLARNDRLELLYAGWLDGNKRPLDLVHLCDHLCAFGAQFRLTIAGDGPLASALTERMTEHIRAGRVRMLGAVPSCDMPALHSEADVLLLVSQSEGAPLVVMEAMATGRPVAITTGCGVASEIITHTTDGLVVPTGDMRTLATILFQLAQERTRGDTARLELMGQAAHATAQRCFSVHACAPRFTALIEEALASPHSAPAVLYPHWLRTLELLTPLTNDLRSIAATRYACAHMLDESTLHAPSSTLLTPLERLLHNALCALGEQGYRRIALYGAGEHTASLGRVISAHDHVIAIVDDRAGKPGGPPAWMHRLPVVTPALSTRFALDAVVLSSDGHEDLLAERANQWASKLPVLRLYNHTEAHLSAHSLPRVDNLERAG